MTTVQPVMGSVLGPDTLLDPSNLEYPNSGVRQKLASLLMQIALAERSANWKDVDAPLLSFHKLSQRLSEISQYATTSRALEIIYEHVDDQHGIFGVLADLWLNIPHAQAVRNRAKIIKAIVAAEVETQRVHGHTPKICSLASGSAFPIIDALSAWGEACELMLIDQDQYALQKAHGRALPNVRIKTVGANVFKFPSALRSAEFVPTLWEVVGLLDYLCDRQIIYLLGSMLKVSGNAPVRMITAHIHLNNLPFDSEVLEEVIGWKGMVRRSNADFQLLCRSAGWKIADVIVEPHQLYSIVVAEN